MAALDPRAEPGDEIGPRIQPPALEQMVEQRRDQFVVGRLDRSMRAGRQARSQVRQPHRPQRRQGVRHDHQRAPLRLRLVPRVEDLRLGHVLGIVDDRAVALRGEDSREQAAAGLARAGQHRRHHRPRRPMLQRLCGAGVGGRHEKGVVAGVRRQQLRRAADAQRLAAARHLQAPHLQRRAQRIGIAVIGHAHQRHAAQRQAGGGGGADAGDAAHQSFGICDRARARRVELERDRDAGARGRRIADDLGQRLAARILGRRIDDGFGLGRRRQRGVEPQRTTAQRLLEKPVHPRHARIEQLRQARRRPDAQREAAEQLIDVGRAILVDDRPPPAASRPPDLARIQQQRIGTRARWADIIDRAVAGAEARPGLLPIVALFEHCFDAARNLQRHEQHRARPVGIGADAQDRRRPAAVEQHAQLGDIARRPQLFVLDDDARHDLVQRIVGNQRAVATQPARQLHPRLALRQPPAAQARGLRRLRRDVDRDAAHLEIARTVDRRDPAPALDLRKRTRAKKERGTGQRREQGTDTHRARLLAKRGR
ncbi:hypothetical protein WR25_22200 [Diploscapter pachys]|uniref:Uncharacterized protein n=1 Tax=Diploscapter pachys TaxID=2018661 RepID=A0A2A2K0V9_9BILA|nr:hypothetical protein WR25_22200 [Diploscapter pachys]